MSAIEPKAPEGQGGAGEPTPKAADDSGLVAKNSELLNELKQERKARREFEAELAALRKTQTEADNKRLEEQGQWKALYEKDKAAWEDKHKSLMDQFHNVTINARLLEAAKGAVNPAQIARLLKPAFALSDDGTVSINDSELKDLGVEIAVNEDKSVSAVVAKFLAANPHLVTSPNGSGAGTRNTPTPTDPNSQKYRDAMRDWKKLSQEERDAFKADPKFVEAYKAQEG